MKKTYKDVFNAPYTYLTPSVRNFSLAVELLLVPQVIMLFTTKSYLSLIILSVSILSSLLAEITNIKLRKEKITENFSMTSILNGMLIGMLIPSTYPIVPVFFIIYISLFVSKYFFGRLSDSWVNPIAFSVIILYLIGMSFFPESLMTRAIIETGNPGIELIRNGSIPVLEKDSNFAFWLNTHIFSHFGIEIPIGYISLFWDSQSVIPAFRFNLLTLISSAILFSFDIINWIIPTLSLGIYAILVFLFSQTPFTGIVGHGDVLFAILTSGTLFTVFFLVDFYGTTPISTIGKIIYGIIAGIIMFFILGSGASSIGCMFSILLINSISPLIQYFEDKIYSIVLERKLRKNGYA